MKRWIVAALAELGLAVVCLVGAVASWRGARITTEFGTGDEHPGFVAVRYVPPLLMLATAAVIVAGLLLIDATARVWAGSRNAAGPVS